MLVALFIIKIFVLLTSFVFYLSNIKLFLGLEVILEEPEEEYCSSSASEDDLRRDVELSLQLKGERRSLDGSEGIGSAEGDTQSSGGSDHYIEEDCASSGIHSEGMHYIYVICFSLNNKEVNSHIVNK